MINESTTLRQLLDMTAVLEQQHGPMQGVVLSRNGRGSVCYTWTNFHFTVEPVPAPAPAPVASKPAVAVAPVAKPAVEPAVVPVPAPMSSLKGGPWHDRFADMQPGQSFIVTSLRDVTAALTAGRRMGIKVTSRKLTTGGWRIWRTK